MQQDVLKTHTHTHTSTKPTWFCSLADGSENDKEAIFPPSGAYHSQQFDHSHFFLFKIIAPTVAADTGKGTNTRHEKGALNLKQHNK